MNTLLFAIVEEGKADYLMQKAKEAGCTGGTILYARGTASNALLCLVGLGDSRKEILLILVEDDKKTAVWNALTKKSLAQGLLASIQTSQDCCSEAPSQWDMVNIICASGYSDDIMASARKATAAKATIIEGRGTAKSDDIAFYGSTLVPEKELLIMFLNKDKTTQVLQAIAALPCMQKKGSGIAFTYSVQELVSLKK